jgi:hypothetical protein
MDNEVSFSVSYHSKVHKTKYRKMINSRELRVFIAMEEVEPYPAQYYEGEGARLCCLNSPLCHRGFILWLAFHPFVVQRCIPEAHITSAST